MNIKLNTTSYVTMFVAILIATTSSLSAAADGYKLMNVNASAYTSHVNQTDSTPFLAAWNNQLHVGIKSIAVSRDLLKQRGVYNGSIVTIIHGGKILGDFKVLDKMNKRFKNKIDIYYGLDIKKAFEWGVKPVVIVWRDQPLDLLQASIALFNDEPYVN